MTMKTMNKRKKLENVVEASDGTADLDIQIMEILNKLDSKNYEWLLITQKYDFPCEGQIHNTRDDLIYDLSNALTCHYLTTALYKKGRRLTENEIRLLENEALDGLGPISRARAKGKI